MSIIYHYTKNAISILENNEIWLTRSVQSNDALDSKILLQRLEELDLTRIFFDMLNKSFKGFGLREFCSNNGYDIFGQVKSNLKRIDNTYYDRINGNLHEKYLDFFPLYIPFVTCFTDEEHKDSRLLWDAYTDCEGCSIGFDEDELRELIAELKDKKYAMLLLNILYSEEKQIEFLKEELKLYIMQCTSDQLTKRNINPFELKKSRHFESEESTKCDKETYKLDIEILNEVIKTVGIKLCLMTPFFKNEFWKEETEKRLVSYNSYSELSKIYSEYQAQSFNIHKDLSKYKNHKNFDYIKMPINFKCIKEVILGPCISSENRDRIISLANANNIRLIHSSGTEVFVNAKPKVDENKR